MVIVAIYHGSKREASSIGFGSREGALSFLQHSYEEALKDGFLAHLNEATGILAIRQDEESGETLFILSEASGRRALEKVRNPTVGGGPHGYLP